MQRLSGEREDSQQLLKGQVATHKYQAAILPYSLRDHRRIGIQLPSVECINAHGAEDEHDDEPRSSPVVLWRQGEGDGETTDSSKQEEQAKQGSAPHSGCLILPDSALFHGASDL